MGVLAMDGGQAENDLRWPIDALTSRISASGVSRHSEMFLTIVDRIHDLVADLRPTANDLRAMIDFLTAVGHASDARRQEWVLLADVIGVSTLVEDVNSSRPSAATPNTVAGPFYRADAPEIVNGDTLSRDGHGVPVVVHGRVTNVEGATVDNALVEVWHANGNGIYENQDPDHQPEFNLRGKIRSDKAGLFWFHTVRPGGYALPTDGPVGRLMKRLGLPLIRPAHLHFRITVPGYETLTTHLFDRADPAIGCDALFGVKPGLFCDIRPIQTNNAAIHYHLDAHFVVCPTVKTASPAHTSEREPHGAC